MPADDKNTNGQPGADGKGGDAGAGASGKGGDGGGAPAGGTGGGDGGKGATAGAGGGDGGKGGSAGDDPKDLESARKRIHELNRESENHRKKANELENKFNDLDTKFKKLGALISGQSDTPPDPAQLEKQRTEEKQRNLLIRAELATVAKDAHDPNALIRSMPDVFKSVKVDLTTDTVDRESLTAAVGEARKRMAFMFTPATGQGGAPTNGNPPPDKGQPAGGGNEKQHWQNLKSQGRDAEASEYYRKNVAAIRAQLGK